MIIFDGIEYESESDVPNFGSIRCTEENGMLRSYEGLSADVDKLPKYVRTGSTFLAIDTAKVYKYEETSKTWFEL